MKSRSRRAFYPARTALSDEIPAQWHALPLKRLFRVVGGSTPPSDSENWDGDITWVTPGDLRGLGGFSISSGKRSITEQGLQSCGTSLVPRGSIILSTRAPIGSLAVAEREMCTNQGCKALVPDRRVSSRFFAYALSISSSQLNALGQGSTFKEISGDTLGAFSLPVPPFEEQCRIAAFLDYETARIDELVREQERLLSLLIERDTAVIIAVVTGQVLISENGDMMASSPCSVANVDDRYNESKGTSARNRSEKPLIAFTGSHSLQWDALPLKRLFRIVGGSTPRGEPEFWDGTIPWVTPGDLSGLSGFPITSGKRNITEQGLRSSGAELVPEGSIILSTRAPIGSLAISERSISTNQGCKALVPTTNSNSTFFAYALSVLTSQLNALGQGATFQEISGSTIGSLQLPAPPVEEQQRIATFLNHHTAYTKRLTETIRSDIDLLRERRSALISAAVTGQLDLRDWQPPDSRVIAEVA